MSAWPQDFEKKLIEAHRMQEPLPVCPPPCHGAILVTEDSAASELTLKCVRCGALASYVKG